MIKLNELEGRWYINQSNFPMWVKGNKTSPTFNYGIIEKGDKKFLSDRVNYIQNGKEKNIKGVNTILNKENTSFLWRGNGLLKLLSSKWSILHINIKNQWAIIYFEKTLFTPAGYDVISRNTELSVALKNDVKEKLNELGIQESLTPIKHNRK